MIFSGFMIIVIKEGGGDVNKEDLQVLNLN